MVQHNKNWKYVSFCEAVDICDTQRKPINSKERAARIEGKAQSDLYPYYGATGQVGYIDDYITDGEFVLLGEDGAPFLNTFAEKAYIITGKAWVNNHAHVLRSKGNNKFLCYYLNHFNYKGYVSGTTRLKLTQAQMKRIPVPIPPIEEQNRIVARIEELFSELDNGVVTLQKIKQQLAVYRQAVLKDAFDRVGENQVPLKRIIEKPRYGTSKKCSYDVAEDPVPVYRIPNVNYLQGTISHDDLKYATFTQDEFDSLKLHSGDILIIRSNGSVALVGRSAVVTEKDTHGLFAGYLMRLRIKDEVEILPQYLNLYLNTHYARYQIEQMAKSTSGVNNINSDEIGRINLPVCDINLQKTIIQEIEARLSVCDSIEQTVDTALQQAEAMRQSILKQAFEGRF